MTEERRAQLKQRLQALNWGDLHVALGVHDKVFGFVVPAGCPDTTKDMTRADVVAWIMDMAGDERFPSFLEALHPQGIVV